MANNFPEIHFPELIPIDKYPNKKMPCKSGGDFIWSANWKIQIKDAAAWKRWGDRNIPMRFKKCGFETHLINVDNEYYRISWGKQK